MLLKKRHAKYPINQSPLYKLCNRKKLSTLLKTDWETLKTFIEEDNNYTRFEKDKRTYHNPKPRMKSIQKRIQILLDRIEKPDCMHSATKGRSYVSNAKAHLESKELYKIDIKKFFDSTKLQHIFGFFHNDMKCPKYISIILTLICTYHDHLPTGSPLSPTLSYFAHKNMFDDLDKNRSLLRG